MARATIVRPTRPATARPAILTIANANATGAVRALGEAAADEARGAGFHVDLVTTSCLEELTEVLSGAAGRRVLIVGGDGTVHALANSTAPAEEFGVVPAGRANNVARALGIPLDPRTAVRVAIDGHVRPIDLIEAVTPTRRYAVVEGISVGYLAEARVHYSGTNSGETLAAIGAGARALTTFHPHRVHVKRHDQLEDVELAQLFVANLPLYGFGLHVAPHADPTDAQLDFVGVESGRLGIPVMLARLVYGSYPDDVHLWRATHGRIATNRASPVVGDSEDLGHGPVDVAVLPRALRIVRP